MRAVIQRCKNASVTIDKLKYSEIGMGLLVLLGIGIDDDEYDIEWLSGKISKLRIFGDNEGRMNLSVKDISGEILIVSQFTLFASTKKGNRPSFIESAVPNIAIPMYEKFVEKVSLDSEVPVKTGVFGANMSIELINDGPVTILIDSKSKE